MFCKSFKKRRNLTDSSFEKICEIPRQGREPTA